MPPIKLHVSNHIKPKFIYFVDIQFTSEVWCKLRFFITSFDTFKLAISLNTFFLDNYRVVLDNQLSNQNKQDVKRRHPACIFQNFYMSR